MNGVNEQMNETKGRLKSLAELEFMNRKRSKSGGIKGSGTWPKVLAY